MLATSGAFEDAQARLAPYATNLLGEFGRGVIVRVRRAGLRFEVLNRFPARRSAPSLMRCQYVTRKLTLGPLQAEHVCLPHFEQVKSTLVSKSPPRKVEHSGE